MYNRNLQVHIIGVIKNKNPEIWVLSLVLRFIRKKTILLKKFTQGSKIINRKNDTLHNTAKYDKKRMAYAIRFNYSNIKLQ